MEIEGLEISCSRSPPSINPSVALVCLFHKAHALYLFLPQFSEIDGVQILKSPLPGKWPWDRSLNCQFYLLENKNNFSEM